MYQNVVILDDNSSGHHGIYLCAISEAFTKLGYRVSVLSPPLSHELCLHKDVNFIELTSNNYIPENSSIFNKIIIPFDRWKHANEVIESAGFRAEDTFVFFNWLDDYAFGLVPALVQSRIFKYAASGIVFKNHFIREDNLLKKFLKFPYALKSKRFSRVAFVETPQKISLMGKLLGKDTISFPDFIDSENHRVDTDFVQRATESLDSALKTIGIIGALSKRKNVLYLLRNSQDLAENGVQVLLVGKLSSTEYSDSELVEIEQIIKCTNSIYLLNEFIPNESTVNAIYEKVDIVWAAYKEWPFTSNAVSKAVFYRKVSIVPVDSYLAEFVAEHKVGISIDDNNKLSPQIITLEDENIDINNFNRLNNFLDVNRLPSLLSRMIHD